jgi:endonuclease/exonuclease/phosphatase family metal-dependent hydrolase
MILLFTAGEEITQKAKKYMRRSDKGQTMMRFLLFFVCAACLCGSSSAQKPDTINVMFYNILKWDDSADYNDFQTIIRHSKPDIVALTEVQRRSIARDIYHCVNTTLGNKYDSTDFYAISFFDKANVLYYNTEKLSLKKQDTIHPVGHRYINRYLLYSNQIGTDTVFLDVYIAHFRPSPGNENARYAEAKTLQNYLLERSDCKNILFCGDLNLYHGNEAAYRLLIDSSACRMYDPVNRRGAWDGNAEFADVHTQSPTRMDSRFDFILASHDVLTGENNLKYLPGTYLALGNDGMHFNQSLITPPLSATVPEAVTHALFRKSDHLPVVAKFVVVPSLPPADEGNIDVYFASPVHDNIDVTILTHSGGRIELRIFDLTGRLVLLYEVENAQPYHFVSLQAANLRQGVFFIAVSDGGKTRTVRKFLKI